MINKVYKLIAFPILLAGMLACSLFSNTPKPSNADIEKKEQEVYSFFASGAGNVALILQDVSVDNPGQTKDFLNSSFDSISKETENDFMDRNKEPGQLSPDMDLGKEYILLKPDELSAISSQPNWGDALKEKYPNSNGYLYFSRVGFNNSLDQALIYVGQVFGPLACTGDYYLLENKNGEWLVMNMVNVIIC